MHTGFDYINKLNIIDIADRSSIDLEDRINLLAMEMKHRIPCWGYSLKDDYKKIVFITDTCYTNNCILLAKKANVLIHEATYSNKYADKAMKHFHTTDLQAMEVADKAQVERLILTHFSQRLKKADLAKWVWKGQSCVVFDERQNII